MLHREARGRQCGRSYAVGIRATSGIYLVGISGGDNKIILKSERDRNQKVR